MNPVNFNSNDSLILNTLLQLAQSQISILDEMRRSNVSQPFSHLLRSELMSTVWKLEQAIAGSSGEDRITLSGESA